MPCSKRKRLREAEAVPILFCREDGIAFGDPEEGENSTQPAKPFGLFAVFALHAFEQARRAPLKTTKPPRCGGFAGCVGRLGCTIFEPVCIGFRPIFHDVPLTP
jgi:hypothetical protein